MVNTSETATIQEGLLCADQDVTTISAQRFEELLKAEIQLKVTLRAIKKVKSYNLTETLDLLFGNDDDEPSNTTDDAGLPPLDDAGL